MVAVLPYLIHRNHAVWPNPAGFDPGRFLPGAPERHRYAWLPFGGGKRGCIGAGFARQETVLVLARLARHYRLDLANPGLPRPRGFVTLRPAGPVTMHLTSRDQPPRPNRTPTPAPQRARAQLDVTEPPGRTRPADTCR
jgi:cytochrome P450